MTEKPGHLNATGKNAWDRIVAECEAARLNVTGKYDVLERYAITYTLWMQCQKRILKEGQLIQGARNQRLIDYHKLTALIGRLRSELGLGPATAAKKKLADESGDDADDSDAVVYRFA